MDAEYYLSLNYRLSLSKDDEGDFVVEVPDLPGCVADGRTAEEALENIRSAMRAWVESRLAAGQSVPEPRTTDEFSGKLIVRMPKTLHQRLALQADEEGVSLNQYMVSLLSAGSVGNLTANSGLSSTAPVRYVSLNTEPIANVNAFVSASGNLVGADRYTYWDCNENNIIVQSQGVQWGTGWQGVLRSSYKVGTAYVLGPIEENRARPIPEGKTKVA